MTTDYLLLPIENVSMEVCMYVSMCVYAYLVLIWFGLGFSGFRLPFVVGWVLVSLSLSLSLSLCVCVFLRVLLLARKNLSDSPNPLMIDLFCDLSHRQHMM